MKIRVTVVTNPKPICQLAVAQMPFMADRLKSLRKSSPYTQKDIADAIGITPQGYSQFERGEIEPNSERVIQFCKIFSCTADYLYGMTDKPWERIELKRLRPDQQKLLELYENRKIPRVLRNLLGDAELDAIYGDRDAAQIEAASEVSPTGKQKAS